MNLEKHKKITDEIAINLGKRPSRKKIFKIFPSFFGGKSILISTTGVRFPPIYCNFISGFLVLFHFHNAFS